MEQKRFPIFAERFSRLRGEKTQGEFADFLGISRPTVGFYENGTRLPDALVLRQIAEKCNVSADWLLGLSIERNADTDIQKVCNYTGLTSSAVEALAKGKDRHPHIDVYNYILENGVLLRYIVNYFVGFTLKKLKTPPYKYIPLKPGSLYNYYEDVYFASAIRGLQLHRQKFEEKYKSNEEFCERAILNFLLSHADMDECKLKIGEVNYDGDQPCSIEDYDEFNEWYSEQEAAISHKTESFEKECKEELDAIDAFVRMAEAKNAG